MMLRVIKRDDNKNLKVICIICKSKSCPGLCRCNTVDRWTPQPPKLA
jgi:hypothetical protein